MMKSVVLFMLLEACSVYCNMASTCNPSELSHSYLETALDMVTKAKNNIPTCINYPKIQQRKAADCADLFLMGYTKSGIYKVYPINRLYDGKSINVYCDMATDGGGWTVIQRRGDFGTPKDYFKRNWENYKQGFGNLTQDFWLGNDKIFALTNQRLNSIRFDLKDVEQNTSYAVYEHFWIDGEDGHYTLHIDLYTGEAGDSMAYSNNLIFSTIDNGNKDNCAVYDKGGWWYRYSGDGVKCHHANLNGLYYKGKFTSGNKDGLVWETWRGFWNALEWTEMKIRPKYFKSAFSF